LTKDEVKNLRHLINSMPKINKKARRALGHLKKRSKVTVEPFTEDH